MHHEYLYKIKSNFPIKKDDKIVATFFFNDLGNKTSLTLTYEQRPSDDYRHFLGTNEKEKNRSPADATNYIPRDFLSRLRRPIAP